MKPSQTSLPACSPITDLAIQFGMPEPNRHGFQAMLERLLGQSKKPTKKAPSKKVAWKAYGPMRSGGCGQCGDPSTRNFNCGPHMSLCDRCYKVLEHSRKHWVPNDDFPSAG